jgi:S1-C subfamily serine protease
VQVLAAGAAAVALGGIAVGLLFATGTIGGDDGTRSVSEIVRGAEASVLQVRLAGAEGPTEAGGSGWVYDAARGLVVTNAHVVNSAPRFAVRLGREKKERPAEVVAVAGCDDLALLRVEDAGGMRALTLGRQSELARGDTVISVGYPGTYAAGDPLVVVTGVVSLPRTQTADGLYQNIVQTDLAQNPGNSGGPLLDLRGRLAGVSTLGEVGTELEGQRYSIGVDRVRKVVPELVRGRSLAWSGMGFYPAAALDLSQLGLPQQDGLLVTNVVEGTPAAEAGIAAPALVLAIDGQVYPDEVSYCRAFREAESGQEATFSILRPGETEPVEVRLPVG